MKINNGSPLVNGYIGEPWIQVNFWRGFLAIVLHFLGILYAYALCLRLGMFKNIEIST
jgi:hypothetical protein